MLDLNFSHFTGPYAYLNGKSHLSVSRLQLLKAMVTVGHHSIFDVLCKVGILGIMERSVQALNYCTFAQGPMILSSAFWQLESTERSAITYRLGQAFTKIVAEEFLNIPYALHLRNIGSKSVLSQCSPKTVINSNVNDGAEPDLVGLDLDGNWHALEAKGRANSITTRIRQKAINQVSRLTFINGHSPTTRVACCFDTTTMKGWIDDPPQSLKEGVEYSLGPDKFAHGYYGHVLSQFVPSRPRSIATMEFIEIAHYKGFTVGMELASDRSRLV